MDHQRFDALARALSRPESRRATLAVLLGSTLGLRAPWGRDVLLDADAKKKKRKNVKGPCAKGKSKKNSCRKNKQCCSGVCQKKRCRCNVCASGCPFTSVQDAIDAANPGDTIHICAGTYGGVNIVNKDLTLRGAGQERTTLDGQENGAVVTIAAGVTVHLEGLRIIRGSATSGGGIRNNGTLTLTECGVSGSSAAFGGGIFNLGSLTLTECSVSGSSADSDGGGIFNLGTLTLTECSVTVNGAGNNGGGIRNVGTLTLTDSSVTDNGAGGDGGGIYNQDTLTLNGTNTIADNEAPPGTPNDCVDAGGGTGCP